ncbi:MAG: hypothetical protein U0491_00065 [Candidatus Saccharimonadales bacterium]
MSEQLRSHEQHTSPEATTEHIDRLKDIEQKAHEAHHEHAEQLEAIRAKVEHEAHSAEEVKDKEESATERQTLHHHITKRIKKEQYQQTLKQVQSHLSKPEKRFSKVIHQPVVETASEVGAKTIARPYSIIGGALFAIIGSFTVLSIAKHVGFEVPNSIFFILFVLGYVVALLVEFVVRMIRKTSPKHRKRHTTSY